MVGKSLQPPHSGSRLAGTRSRASWSVGVGSAPNIGRACKLRLRGMGGRATSLADCDGSCKHDCLYCPSCWIAARSRSEWRNAAWRQAHTGPSWPLAQTLTHRTNASVERSALSMWLARGGIRAAGSMTPVASSVAEPQTTATADTRRGLAAVPSQAGVYIVFQCI